MNGNRATEQIVIGGYVGAIGGVVISYCLALVVSFHWLASPVHVGGLVLSGALCLSAGIGFVSRRWGQETSWLAILPMICLVVLVVIPLTHAVGYVWLIKNYRLHGGDVDIGGLWKITAAFGGVLVVGSLVAVFVIFRHPLKLWNGVVRHPRVSAYGTMMFVHSVVIGLVLMMPGSKVPDGDEDMTENAPTEPPQGISASPGVDFSWRDAWSDITGRAYSTGSWRFDGRGSLEILLGEPTEALTWFGSRVLSDDVVPRWFAPIDRERGHCMTEWSLEFDGAPSILDQQADLGRVEQRFEVKVPSGARSARLSLEPSDDCSVQLFRFERSSPVANPPRRVLLISLDTTAQQHMRFGTASPIETSPTLDRLVTEDPLAVGFTNSIGSSSRTLTAHATAWTGLYPSQHGLNHNEPVAAFSENIVTLSEIVKSAGFGTFGLVSHTLVDAIRGYSRGMDHFSRYEGRLGKRGRELLDDAYELLNKNRDDDVFMFIHLFDAHFPYTNYPENHERLIVDTSPENPRDLLFGDLYADRIMRSGGRDPRQRPKNVERYGDVIFPAMPAARVAYQLGIRDVDDMLGVFFERLKKSGLFEGTTIVIFADHGEEFFDHGTLTHTSLYRENIRLPMIVKLGQGTREATKFSSGMGSFVDRSFESHTTVFKIMCDLVGQPYPDYLKQAGTEALSLDELLALKSDRPAWSETYYGSGVGISFYDISLIEDGRHAILTTYTSESSGKTQDPYMQLYDFRDDLRERHNLFSTSDPAHQALQKRLESRVWQISQLEFSETADRALTSAEKEALEALGYLSQ